MGTNSGTLQANRVDIESRTIRSARLRWADGVITEVTDLGPPVSEAGFLIPGFVDAHVHIESSLLTPAEFARVAVRHGTVATVSDPHEIGNVLGVAGVRWMIDNAAQTPFHILFGAPSCVPATEFETSGARLDASEIEELLDTPGVGYLTEVMNYPAVLAREAAMMAKVEATRRRGLPVDGHAPGLVGEAVRHYADAGITTDHECATLAEAEEKIHLGMRILIREGSAARNFDALHPLISLHPGRTMLCTDDYHPHELVRGHIDRLVARAVALGHDVFTVLEAACLTPQEHYGLDLGRLRPGDPFNAALVADLTDFRVRSTWLGGELVATDGVSLLPRVPCVPVNRFGALPLSPDALSLPAPDRQSSSALCRVIVAEDGQLLTGSITADLPVRHGRIVPDPGADILQLTVVNRYQPAPPALGFIRGFGLTNGALAASIAHDSHNVIAVGTDAWTLARAVNAVIEAQGGLAVVTSSSTTLLPLPVAGLMSDLDADEVATLFAALNEDARTLLGTPLRAPFMTLSFMALLVIPSLKLSDRGLFDADRFEFTGATCPS